MTLSTLLSCIKSRQPFFFFYSHLLSVPQMPNDFETTAEPSGQLTHTQADEHDWSCEHVATCWVLLWPNRGINEEKLSVYGCLSVTESDLKLLLHRLSVTDDIRHILSILYYEFSCLTLKWYYLKRHDLCLIGNRCMLTMHVRLNWKSII